jgi:hypothetical protein
MKTINAHASGTDGIVVFDRGVSFRKSYTKIIKDDLQFISRVNKKIT